MTKNELLKEIVPATKMHWESLYNKTYNEADVYNALKTNSKAMMFSRYNTLKNLGYIH